MKIVIFANALHTNTFSGGDKIFLECAKRWTKWGHHVTIVTNEAGERYCLEAGIAQSCILLWRASAADQLGYVIAVTIKTITSCIYGMFTRVPDADVLFASSFFLPDVLPALILKLTHKNVQLVTASYIFTKEPLGRDYSGGKFKGLLFYINEVISLAIAKRFGSKALTASPYDRKRFIELKNFDEKDVLAVRGGVDNAFFQSVSQQPIRYDAVFMDRFHPQKCVAELIDIWETVVRWDNKRVLALIGRGIQEAELRNQVQRNGLEKNIIFLGVKDGIEKAKILKSSRLFLSASRYDTGNIALDEGLACELPGIIYDLQHLDYPKGVIKIPTGEAVKFSDAIISILTNDELRVRLSCEALAFAMTIDWDVKAKLLLELIRA